MEPRPDVVIATGDLVHTGAPAEYEMLHLSPGRYRVPVYLVPGNHDHRENFAAVSPTTTTCPSAASSIT